MAGIFLSIPDTSLFKDRALTWLNRAEQGTEDQVAAAGLANAYATLYTAGVLQDFLNEIKGEVAQLGSALGSIEEAVRALE